MLLLALLALVVLSAGSASAGPVAEVAAAERRATLKITSVQPLTVVGLGFKSAERVRVSTESRGTSVRASTRGRFTVRFGAVDPCNGLLVRAVGEKGSRTSLAFNAGWRVHCASP